MKSDLLAQLRAKKFYAIAGSGMILFLWILGMNALPTQDFKINPNTNAIIQAAVQNQNKIVSEIQAYSRGQAYSFNHPLILQNPFGTAPLTALVIFDTSAPLQISVHVPGKTPLAAVDFTFTGLSKHHEIPIYGLYANTSNQVTLTAQNLAGKTSQTVLEISTEPLPVYLDSVNILHANPELYAPGMNFALQDNKIVFDINGDIRWFSTEPSFQTFLRLRNGHYLFTYSVPDEPNNIVMEEDLLGKIYAVYNIPDGVQHDFAELPNGNLLMTSQDSASNSEKDFLIEVNRKNGMIMRSFDLRQYLDPARPAEIGFDAKDWFHLNSIAYDANDQSILISGRTQSAVIKMSYPAMKIQWILGPHDNWSNRFQPYLLTPLGDPFEWQWSQHDASILSEKTANGSTILDVLLFDNGNYRSFDVTSALSPEASYSRIVHYQVDESARTVKQVWEYGKERGSEIFSSSRGSAYRLDNGNYLGTWAEIVKGQNGAAVMNRLDSGTDTTRIIEVDPDGNQVVFEASMNHTTNYRTLRANLYDGYADQDSILSGKINDTSAFNLQKQAITDLQPLKKNLDELETLSKESLKNSLKRLGLWQMIR